MFRLFDHHFRRRALLQVLCDGSLLILSLVCIYLFQFPHAHDQVFPVATHGLSLAAGLLFINTASGLYRAAHARSLNQSFARATLALLLALPLAWIAFGLALDGVPHRDEFLWLTMLCIAVVIGHRACAAHVAAVGHPHTRVLVFGAGPAAQGVADTIAATDPQVEIVGFVAGPNETQTAVDERRLVRATGTLKELAERLRVDDIVVALTERRGGSMPLRELLDCKTFGVGVFDISAYFERMLGQIRIDQLHAGWLVFGDGFSQRLLRSVVKRLFDVVAACVLLLLSAPVMLIAGVAVVLESKGPVFYRQKRVGLDGEAFSVLKFRSMRIDAESDGAPRWAVVRDARITRVGAFLRRFRIDEFPQLFNVLIGEMSLVGPRPERPFFVEQLTRDIPFYAVRHSVKPGVTGWAQVRYQYGATVEDSREKLQYDLHYVKNHSLFLDIVILFETIGVVLSGKGAR